VKEEGVDTVIALGIEQNAEMGTRTMDVYIPIAMPCHSVHVSTEYVTSAPA
jgi:hypothetical protein